MNYSIKYKVTTAALAISIAVGGLSLAPAPTTYAAEVSAINQVAEVTWGVNLRTGPSTANKAIRMISKGEQVTVIGVAANGWLQVTDGKGNTGYISNGSKYTEVVGNSTSAPSSSSSNSAGNTVSASSNLGKGTIVRSVSFREGAGTSYPRMRYIKKGEQVTVISKTGSWYKVTDANGVTGYVSSSSKYISVNGTGSNINTGSSSNTGSSNNTGSSSNSGSTVTNSNAAVEKVIAAGMKYLGTPYEYGSNRNTTTTFDCSDFVRQAFMDALGINVGGDSRKQGAYVKELGNAKTSISQLERGDLMFFMSYKGTSKSSYSGINKSTARITHVGIYLGDGKILHTYSKESGGVKVDTFTGKHWEHRFLYGGSAIK
ncbi:C40 family peptidase [Paenibacillus sp. FSL W7-1287]|uniref:C40 family peptidase n=1 Tax=Paenibacillus sp. FSL W7-1287 TaxID=2954538 RepID=UPI0030FB5FC1